MDFIGSEKLKTLLKFALDIEKQTAGGRLALTLLDVYQITGEGTIGPGRGDEDRARRIKRPARRSASDTTGYWDLAQGVYWVTYNETVRIPDEGALILQPSEDLLNNGLWHPTLLVRDWSEIEGVLLNVGARGVRIGEGAIISVGYMTMDGSG